jgi:hypothetical protein
MDPGRSDRHQGATIHRSCDYGEVQLLKPVKNALSLPIATVVLVASAEIGNRPTALHVPRNQKFELCENSASSAAVATAAAGANAHNSISARRVPHSMSTQL